jgi:hypothetical protein
MDKKFQIGLEIDDHILHLSVSDISEITRLSACTAKKERKENDYLGTTRVPSMHRNLRGGSEGKKREEVYIGPAHRVVCMHV